MSVSIKVDKYTVIDLVKCPHILIGGSTGSGKSYLMKSMLGNVLDSNDCRVIVVDPKCVDYMFLQGVGKFEPCKGIEKKWLERGDMVLTRRDIESNYVLMVLKSIEREMGIRYDYMMSKGFVEWQEYLDSEECNKYDSIWEDKRIVILIDELADLIYWDREKSRGNVRCELESSIVKLSTLGRAAGIHLILGTQRPDATILSGQLRANISCRICLKVVNNMERRIILGDSCKDLGERVLYYDGMYRELIREI